MSYPRAILTVDLARLRENFAAIRDRVSPCKCLAVIKADAYGLGIVPVAATLAPLADVFAVAELQEALDVAKFNVPVMIFGALFDDEIPVAIANDFIIPVGCFESAEKVNAAAGRLQKKCRVVLVVDSGMGRLGESVETAAGVVVKAAALKNISIQAVYTHCATAAEKNDIHVLRQIEKFKAMLSALGHANINIPDCHIAASDAIFNYPESLHQPFNFARIGLAMYGMNQKSFPDAALKSVCRFSSRLLAVRRLPAGSAIGYGRSCILKESMLVGTVGCGYSSGLPLALSNTGRMLVRGVSCPVLGRVSMDYTTISLQNVPDAEIGDEVVALGEQGNEIISAGEWAELKKTHVHEILCSISGRVERKYING